jgi:hypothetical protein
MDDHIIANDEGKLTSLRGGLSSAGDIFLRVSGELHNSLQGRTHPASQDMSRHEKGAGLPALATPPLHISIRKRLFAVDDPCLPGIGCRLGAVDQVQFAEDVADMPLDRTHADHQLIGDLVI